jgi:hypothetical protein
LTQDARRTAHDAINLFTIQGLTPDTLLNHLTTQLLNYSESY